MKTTKLNKIAITSLIAGGVLLPVVSYACYSQITNKPKPQSAKAEAQLATKPETANSTVAAAPTAQPNTNSAKPDPAPVKKTTSEPTSAKINKTGDPNYNQTSKVNSISLSGSGSDVSWVVSGTAVMGFKVVWSKNPGPTYPTRAGDKYHYISDQSATADSIYAFDGSGTYYVRVCEYLGGKCGTYSNQITVSLP